MADRTIVYGARCTWWDTADKAASKPSGLPCCPHCGSVLFQSDEPAWWAGVDRFERDGHPGYRAQIEWIRGRCLPVPTGFRAPDVIAAAFAEFGATDGE